LSIKTLLRSRQHESPSPIPPAATRALLIAMKDTPGYIPQLRFAAEEVAMLHGICKSMAIDSIEPRRYKPDVLALLPSCQIFHFAGHGSTNRADPSQSQLLLEDWSSDPLTVSTLMAMNLRERSPFLAYLSACGTGRIQDGSFADESIHLIGACHIAGFRHVVGTLWEVNDETCVDIARMTYEEIRDKGMSDESVCRGLHRAARQLQNAWVSKRGEAAKLPAALSLHDGDPGRGSMLPRDIGADDHVEDPLYWVPYVHFGV